MNGNLKISDYLNDVHADWQSSLNSSPINIFKGEYWPIPFFGNPATALVATIGANPSSLEFDPARRWPKVTRENRGAWKKHLKTYFTRKLDADDWFDPWTIGLALLDCSYQSGTAAHMDVSYRPTTAMLTNPETDRREFREMAERDVQWLFKLLPLCPKLRVLLTMGPITGTTRKTDGLFGFLCEFAPRHGFKVIRGQKFWELWHEKNRQVLAIHEADTADEKCITCRVVKNIFTHRDDLRCILDK